MSVLSKQYKGLFYWVAIALTVASSVLTSPELADLGWTWVTPAASAVTFLLLTVQRFTGIGDSEA